MIDAFAYGYEVLGDTRYRDAAQKAAEFILEHLTRTDGQLMRTKNPYDSALPSGNAVAINNLLTLARLTGEKDYLDKAEKSLRSFASVMAQSPGGFMHMLLGANNFLSTDWTEAAVAQEKQHPQLATKLNGEGGINANSPLKGLSGIGLPAGDDVVKVSVPELSNKQISQRHPFDIEVHLEIGDGWHINANPASDDFLIPTTVSVSADAAVEVISASYPKGKPLTFSFSDQPLSVYEGVLRIQMQLQMKPGVSRDEAFPLNLNLEYQACDDQRCLPPSTDSIQLRLDNR